MSLGPVSNAHTRARRLKLLTWGAAFQGVDCVQWYSRLEPCWAASAGWACVMCGALAHTKAGVTHRLPSCQKELDTLLLLAQYLHGIGILPAVHAEQMR